MTKFSRSAKVSTILLLIVVVLLVLLFSFSRTLGLTTSASAQDDNSITRKSPPNDPPSADKKDEPATALSRFMRQKLQASNLILEGLCTEDLKMVSEGSASLKKMSIQETWRVSNDMMYRRYSTEFVSAVEELQKEAEDNNMDGTSMAWVNVTMKCLKCHEWVRNAVFADGNK
ncbi:MAG: hypothetical protein NT138_15275 [Planctomycetales bacterium]|jgi:hypothetical protein|nr:hypothetical protein [Planctomycetales bacterium]